ncbi:MAG: phage tail protein [Gammaproteobacteria bacterium]|nr:phage tail protein [Gammaproteobacteria bacterium]
MSEPFIAEVRMWGCNYAPRGWAFCDGQLLPVAENTALFSLVGTLYGGDGRTTLGLPNLTDRSPMQQGSGPGLSSRPIGQFGGTAQEVLAEAQIPTHDHIVRGVTAAGSAATPASDLYMGQDKSSRGESIFYTSTDTTMNTTLSAEAIGASGSSQAHENQQPFLGVNFCIALQGIYPSRS